jgi:hypothetical protein
LKKGKKCGTISCGKSGAELLCPKTDKSNGAKEKNARYPMIGDKKCLVLQLETRQSS